MQRLHAPYISLHHLAKKKLNGGGGETEWGDRWAIIQDVEPRDSKSNEFEAGQDPS